MNVQITVNAYSCIVEEGKKVPYGVHKFAGAGIDFYVFVSKFANAKTGYDRAWMEVVQYCAANHIPLTEIRERYARKRKPKSDKTTIDERGEDGTITQVTVTQGKLF